MAIYTFSLQRRRHKRPHIGLCNKFQNHFTIKSGSFQRKHELIWTFPGDSFKKHKIKTNPKMYILMYFKIQSGQPRITPNALKSKIFDFLTKSSSGHK